MMEKVAEGMIHKIVDILDHRCNCSQQTLHYSIAEDILALCQASLVSRVGNMEQIIEDCLKDDYAKFIQIPSIKEMFKKLAHAITTKLGEV